MGCGRTPDRGNPTGRRRSPQAPGVRRAASNSRFDCNRAGPPPSNTGIARRSRPGPWGRFGDFLRAYDLLPPAGSPPQYLLLTTPDGGYSSALDLPSALHPQTLLCDAMNGVPLTEAHDGPIRLVLPIKYGIMNIKWLADIRFLTTKPTDYWTRRGYDWYAGL